MQYILTEEEYKNLVPKMELDKLRELFLDSVEALNKKVLELSNFQCAVEYPRLCSYCDNCPIGGFGTNTCMRSK
ncbi:MAG: hypothetical protein J6V44_12725 [Methanobrevibacter sp.]|nr:hypothetical protein [Methanobrevibacter sp.]